MMSEIGVIKNKVMTVSNMTVAMDSVRNRFNELEEQILKITDFDRKVAARNTWRRRSGKTHGRWNK